MLWSSSEFGFVELDDAFATGSSLMPQKKNPDAAELVRGKSRPRDRRPRESARDLKGLPLSYNRDMQEDKEPVIDAVETARDCLGVLTGVISTLSVNAAAMARAAADPMLVATDLADHLVLRGVPFREAHGLVGRVVARALEEGVTLAELSPETLRSFHPSLDVSPGEFFRAERSLEARRAAGAPSRAQVEISLRDARAELERARAELARAES